MNAILPPPATGRRKAPAPTLASFPALALAASATTAELDANGDAFAGVMACLDTLARLKLGVRSVLILGILAKHGSQPMTGLAVGVKATSAAITESVLRLRHLGLLTETRVEHDRRLVMVTITDAGRKVLASIVALTALGQAANVLTLARQRKTSN